MSALNSAPVLEGGRSLQLQGRRLLTAIHAAAQALKLYPLENATVQNALDELHGVARRIVEGEGGIELRVVGDFVFLNDARLRLDLDNFAIFSFLAGALARHEIAVIEIDPGIDRAEWAPLLSLLLNTDTGDAPFERFAARLAESSIRHVQIDAERDKAPHAIESDHVRAAAKRTYFQTIQVAREVMGDVRFGKAVNVRRVKRAVQSIVDQVINHETTMLGMTTLRDYDEYTFAHSVNVCILSVIIGQKLGFTKSQLYELGLGALFHDIGKMRVDPEILAKAGPLTDEEFMKMREHPVEGFLSLFSIHGFSDLPYRAMLVAYEHHMKIDLTGYPRSRRFQEMSLFSRIVAVADGFDAGTAERVYQPSPPTPDAVLRWMRDDPDRGFDPRIVKVLINVTGVYPVGTLVILDTYELAVVLERSADPSKLHQPIVQILADALGLPLAEPKVVDLSEIDPGTGQPYRTIIKTTDPEKYGIRVADIFL